MFMAYQDLEEVWKNLPKFYDVNYLILTVNYFCEKLYHRYLLAHTTHIKILTHAKIWWNHATRANQAIHTI